MAVSPSNAPAPVQAPASPQPAEAPRFASMHTLLMRIDQLTDLPQGNIWVRNQDGILEERTPLRDSPQRLEALLEAIAAGRVYALWDHRYLEFDELTPNWPNTPRQAVPDVGTSA